MILKQFNLVAFDLDYTLYDESSYYRAAFKEMSLHLERKDICKSGLAYKLMCETLDDYGTTRPLLKFALENIGVYTKELEEVFFRIYKTVAADIEAYDDALDFIAFLHKKDIPMAIITNGVAEAQRNKLRLLDIESYFKYICYASEHGKERQKPSVFPFQKVCERFNIDPQSMIYIADNPEIDFIGVKALDVFTVRLLRGEFKDKALNRKLCDLEVYDYYEIKDLFG